MPHYLTKSRFKLALECPTKLYYTNKKDEYADERLDDAFLAALAEGGFQVAELAKYLFCEEPLNELINIEEKDYETALANTQEKLSTTDKLIIAEAAFRYENLFARVDIMQTADNELHIYEVKAKSWNSTKDFWKVSKGEARLDKDWLPYLQDIAFQKYIVQKVNPDLKVFAYLILVDSDSPATIEGLNQLFRIEKQVEKTIVRVREGINRSSLGNIPLRIIPVDKECDWIYSNTLESGLEQNYSFEETISKLSQAYSENERIWSPIGVKCKKCQFITKNGDLNLKSGFSECWKHWAKLGDYDLKKPLTLEIWGGLAGNKSIAGDAIANGKYLLSELEDVDFWPSKFSHTEPGLHPAERRKLQIDKVKLNDSSYYLKKDDLKRIFATHSPPYHFIDFETTSIALPFHPDRKPYEGIAFQYSYHLMDEMGNIEHKSQYLSLEPNFPNYNFLRALRNDLREKGGTIFRYHNHENTFLRLIYTQLQREKEGMVPDRNELIDFIRDITNSKENDDKWTGINDMVDLWKLVLAHYYSPRAKGSNSLKDILPAVIHDSIYIKNKYSQPIYGTERIRSLNFRNHIWISEDSGMNPYKTLPPVLDGFQNEDLEQFIPAIEEIAEGGAAMMAYAYLQFSDVTPAQKELIKNALYRYCELDTMAMVMIWEFWGNEIGRFR